MRSAANVRSASASGVLPMHEEIIEDPPLFRGTDRYRPLSHVGAGAMGAVYRVDDLETGSVVALKTLHSAAPEQIYRLKGEFRALAGIVHPNLVHLYDLHVGEDGCFFTMEYVDGCDFVRYVRGGAGEDRARLERFLAPARELLQGLAALHAAGRLHRDIKPSNVLVTATGAVKLLDFDLALVTGGHETGQGEIAGTVAYMAPEQAWALPIGPAADVYAAGAVFYEALAGVLPLAGDATRLLIDKRSVTPPRLRALGVQVPAWLDELIVALLAAEPDQRPPLDAVLARFAAPGSAATPALAAPWARGRDTDFVGRDRERQQLRASYQAFRSSGAAVVRVHGASGIGKTELLRRFTDELQADGDALILPGRCDPRESVPYKALDSVVDALSHFLLEEGEPVLAGIRPAELDALARLFPVLARVPAVATARRRDAGDSVEMRQRGVRALRQVLHRIGAARPLVVWIDDVQWGDADSATLLRALLLPPDPPPLLLLASFRTEDRDHATILPVLSALAAQGERLPAHEIEIGPMDERDALRLAARLRGATVDADGDARAIVAQSDGSPFAIAEMARCAARGEVRAERVDWNVVMRQRLERLPAEAREIAEIAAVAAGPIDRRILLTASERRDSARPLIALLESECVLRSANTAGDVLHTYHDRVREAVVAQLSHDALARCHRRLAITYESLAPRTEPELLARHFHGAGELPKAAGYAVAAADRAARALAFARAAELYRAGREWDPGDATRRRTLLACEGEALANATRFIDAADAYRSAAEGAPRLEALELRRNAAEHLISAGSVDDGLRVLTGMLRELGLRYPRTPTTAMLGLGAGLAVLRWSGPRLGRGRGAPTTEELLRVDTCYSAAKSLVDSDSIRGVYFSLQALRRALVAGDPIRLGRSLAVLGGSLSVFPGAWIQRLGGEMLARAEAIGAETGSPLLRGTIAIASGQVLMMGGHWRTSLDRLDEGIRLLTEQSRGAAFEALVGRTMSLRSLEELGELPPLEARAREILQISRTLGNRHAELAASDHLAGALMVRGEIAEARELLGRNFGLWTAAGFHLQHLYTIRRAALCDLYAGAARQGYDRVLAVWRPLRRSQLLRVSLSRVDAFWLRGRLALAGADGAAAALSDAARCQARLARERRADAAVYALLLDAGIRSTRGDRRAVAALLGEAGAAATRAGMTLHAAAAELARASVLTGDDARRCRESAEPTLRRCGVTDPARFTGLYAPGFPLA